MTISPDSRASSWRAIIAGRDLRLHPRHRRSAEPGKEIWGRKPPFVKGLPDRACWNAPTSRSKPAAARTPVEINLFGLVLLLGHSNVLSNGQIAYFREDHFSGGRPVNEDGISEAEAFDAVGDLAQLPLWVLTCVSLVGLQALQRKIFDFLQRHR